MSADKNNTDMKNPLWDWYPPNADSSGWDQAFTFVLIPFFQGHPSALKKHAEWLSSLGFSVAVLHLDFKVFELMNALNFEFKSALDIKNLTNVFGLLKEKDWVKEKFWQKNWVTQPVLTAKKALSSLDLASPQGGFGLKHVLADQVQHSLNQIEGEKIVTAFSNIAASAIEALARRKCYDVKCLICDSGPSSRISESIRAHFTEIQPIPFFPVRLAVAQLSELIWSPNFAKELHQDLEKLPENFPVLSIRGWKDTIVKPDEIDSAFEPHSKLNWSKLSLPQGKHLNGFKDFNSIYCQGVLDFLDACEVSLAANR